MDGEERIPTNLRTLLILEIIGRSDHAMTPTEINADLDLPKQTIHRLCATLVEEGFLTYERDGKRLRPARRSRLMGSGLLHASRGHIARRQILEQISRTARETVNFVVPEDSGMNYIDRVETDWAFRVQLPIGTHVPFHCTASGKTFLAGLTPTMRRKMVNSLTLEAKTATTFTDAGRLLEELDRISKAGYALDNEEFMDGMAAIAVPIRDSHGRYLASVAIHGPRMRLSNEKLLSMKDLLLDAAQKLSLILTDE